MGEEARVLGPAQSGLPAPEALVAAIASATPGQLRSLVPLAGQVGEAMKSAGAARYLGGGLGRMVAPLLAASAQPRLGPMHAHLALTLLAFSVDSPEEWAQAVFDDLVLPWMDAAAAAGQFNTAFALETMAYNAHVKRRESQEWFKRTAGRWLVPLAAHARAARGRFAPPHERWRPEATRRIAFFLHNATLLAHVQVLAETLEGVHAAGGAPGYAFTVFAFSGRNAVLEARLAACGVRLRYLEQPGDPGLLERLVRLQGILREENFIACIWVTLVTLMGPAFAFRIAPLQVWWAMKYHACDVPEIDARLALENVVLRKRLEGHDWLTIGNSSARWIVPGREAEASALRAGYPADRVVAACVGREEKLDSPDFLRAISTLLERHPELVFLWTGRARRDSIQSHFERAGVADRTVFVGWVDTKLYAQAVDLFLDSFPFPCGFSLKEAMAAGKAAVMFRSPESLETGVPGSLSPAAQAEDCVAPDVREALRRIFTDRADFDLYLCADTPEQYVELASRAISDRAHRDRVGAANREYIERFVSSPEAEAAKFIAHLDALCARVPMETA
jgi:glycosyltransferase involved in cell wall biosynthesis